jgi:ribulose-5-phosphate 4-epimerase/fuculose-1-phosphate aldolase
MAIAGAPMTAVTIEDQVQQARVDLAAALRLAAKLEMNEGIDNHFTARVPGTTDRFLINPKNLHWSEIRASDLLVVDPAGRVMEPSEYAPPRSGVAIHLPIHLVHPRGGAVFHLHMPWSTALTCIEDGRFEMVHQNSARFYGDVAYDDEYNSVALDQDEGRRMARVFGDKTVMFLANHGVIVATETIAEAFDTLYYLERASQVQVLAMSTGRPLKVMSEALALRTRADFGNVKMAAARHFEALKRIYLDHPASDYLR